MSRLKTEYKRPDEHLEGCQALANAVVVQAAKDYRTALRHLRKHPGSPGALSVKRGCETFFHSHWFSQLTGIDPDYILKRIREEEAA